MLSELEKASRGSAFHGYQLIADSEEESTSKVILETDLPKEVSAPPFCVARLS